MFAQQNKILGDEPSHRVYLHKPFIKIRVANVALLDAIDLSTINSLEFLRRLLGCTTGV